MRYSVDEILKGPDGITTFLSTLNRAVLLPPAAVSRLSHFQIQQHRSLNIARIHHLRLAGSQKCAPKYHASVSGSSNGPRSMLRQGTGVFMRAVETAQREWMGIEPKAATV